jgi:UPF0176 protein
MNIINIAAYKFVPLDNLPELRERFVRSAHKNKLKGTILLAPEGINLFLAGAREGIDDLLALIKSFPALEDLVHKESPSDAIPFAKLLVKIKREIITLRMPEVAPALNPRAPVVDAHTLKKWLDQGHDDAGRKITLVDTRNDFELKHGTFKGAERLGLHSFSAFGKAIEGKNWQGQTVVTFCTGGIRCEKAALYMRDSGIENVLQLDGGILKYFELEGGAHYQGNCFVFDERVALTPELLPDPEKAFTPQPYR